MMSKHTKQVIIVRKDLNMRKGKMIAQGAHASMGAVFEGLRLVSAPDGEEFLALPNTEDLHNWLVVGKFTKIALGINSEKELLDLAAQAKEAGLPHFLVRDAGLTEFDGVPTYTSLAIGPATSDRIDLLTGKLSLL